MLGVDDLESERAGDVLPRTRGLFLKGPISWAWLAACGRLRGRALHVGLALWLESGMRGSPTVALRPKHRDALGVDRHAARRALVAMEAAGLVGVERGRGRAPTVTLRDVE